MCVCVSVCAPCAERRATPLCSVLLVSPLLVCPLLSWSHLMTRGEQLVLLLQDRIQHHSVRACVGVCGWVRAGHQGRGPQPPPRRLKRMRQPSRDTGSWICCCRCFCDSRCKCGRRHDSGRQDGRRAAAMLQGERTVVLAQVCPACALSPCQCPAT